MSEKPLHVRVAEALGCNPKLSHGTEWDCKCRERQYGRPHSTHLIHDECCHDGEGLGCDLSALARYDEDWSATGPLIVEYRLSVVPTGDRWHAALDEPNGYAVTDDDCLVAVCRLILALHAAGKLDLTAPPHKA